MEAITISVDDAAKALGIGLTKTRELIAEGKICAVKIDRRTLVRTDSIRHFVDSLSAAA